jgi:hypothetical protein
LACRRAALARIVILAILEPATASLSSSAGATRRRTVVVIVVIVVVVVVVVIIVVVRVVLVHIVVVVVVVVAVLILVTVIVLVVRVEDCIEKALRKFRHVLVFVDEVSKPGVELLRVDRHAVHGLGDLDETVLLTADVLADKVHLLAELVQGSLCFRLMLCEISGEITEVALDVVQRRGQRSKSCCCLHALTWASGGGGVLGSRWNDHVITVGGGDLLVRVLIRRRRR